MNADLQLAKRLISIVTTAIDQLPPSGGELAIRQGLAVMRLDLEMALDAIDRAAAPPPPGSPTWRQGMLGVERPKR